MIKALVRSATVFSLATTMLVQASPWAAASALGVIDSADIRKPINQLAEAEHITNQPSKPEAVSDFAASPFKLVSTAAKVPMKANLRLVVQETLSAKKSKLGDEFKAKVSQDFYLEGDFRKLIIPKDSWIRGKVSFVKKPGLISRSGKLGIKLDSLITPQADYVPLNADLIFAEGMVNEQGLLDPQTGFKDKAIQPTKKLLSSDTGKIASVATLGVPVMGTLVAGSVIALFSHGDSASVAKGQELQIVLTKDTNLSLQ